VVCPMSPFETAFRLARRWPLFISVAVAAAVVVSAVASGIMASSNTTLVLMGFDMDRAQLITSLLIAGAAAATATLATDMSGRATLAGLGGFAALFGPTFLDETRNALAATGVNGSFDFGGFLSTLLTLLTAGVVSSWAGATLALALRPGLIAAGHAIRDAIRSRRIGRSSLKRPIIVAAVLVLLIHTVPVFGDMVNYTPDSEMLHGRPPEVGLIPGAAAHFSGTQLSSQRPWLAWLPSGGGSITGEKLRAPWLSPSGTTSEVGVYTPPGYDASLSRRYPVLYAVPFDYSLWDSSVNIRVVLDTLIDSGQVPPMIVAFVSTAHAPIADTECANSVDGIQWLETYISQTAVSFVDSHYRTIARAEARAITGFSEGGYCAAILPLRHPEVFGTAIPMSGYFWAGDGGEASKVPFGGDASVMGAASPMIVATELQATERAKLFFIVVAQPSQPLYGPQATEFEHLLTFEGYPYLAVDAKVPHGWEQVRQELPAVLEAWAAHLAAAAVFN
jgi:enterochelin esterase-like enzyme